MDIPLLWHIRLSHYGEKVRWALDYKGIAHRRRVLGPDYMIRAWRATGQGKLPVLWLDGRAIADSTRIIAALEEHYPEPPLYPSDTATRQRALALDLRGQHSHNHRNMRSVVSRNSETQRLLSHNF